MREKGGKYDFIEITNFHHHPLYAPESPVYKICNEYKPTKQIKVYLGYHGKSYTGVEQPKFDFKVHY